MPASPFVARRILMIAHALPQPEQGRLWRWIEAGQTLGDLWLITPAGPSLHLRRWQRLAASVSRLSVEPGTPLYRPARFRRQARQWRRETTFDAVICTAPGTIQAVDAGDIPLRVVDTHGATVARAETSLFRIRPFGDAIPDGWRTVTPEEDPITALRRALTPRTANATAAHAATGAIADASEPPAAAA